MTTPASTQTKPTFFLNLPTTSLPAAKTFYTTLGFTPVPEFTDSSTASFLLPAPNQSISLMIHTHTRFKTFMRPHTEVADTRSSTEALFSIMCETQEEVDEWLGRVETAGGKKDPYIMEGFGEGMGMYCRSWEDLDGHIWEVVAVVGELKGPQAGAEGEGQAEV